MIILYNTKHEWKRIGKAFTQQMTAYNIIDCEISNWIKTNLFKKNRTVNFLVFILVWKNVIQIYKQQDRMDHRRMKRIMPRLLCMIEINKRWLRLDKLLPRNGYLI